MNRTSEPAMSNRSLLPIGLRPHVPAGRDYAGARRFYRAMGFNELWEFEGLSGFALGAAAFLLHQGEELAPGPRSELRLDVTDLFGWWSHLGSMELPQRFPGVTIRPPTSLSPVVRLVAPGGVVWHIGGR